jgi:rod shape-determining protein MreC
MARPSAQLRAAVQRTAPALLIAVSVAIVMIGKADQGVFASLRTAVADDVSPLLDTLSRPLGSAAAAVQRVRGFFRTYADNRRLERDNARLLEWQQVALKLSDQNAQLRKLLRVVPEKSVSFVTARIIASSGGGFVRTLMVNAGADQGAARGEAALAGGGLAGRLTEVGSRAARVLLITDLNSRIPVIDQRSHQPAILAGDNSDRPKLLYVKDPGAIQVGDRVVTSGDGGVLPPGLPVGIVANAAAGAARVEPYAELSQAEYLMVVDYGLSDGLPEPAAAGRAARKSRRLDVDEAGVR